MVKNLFFLLLLTIFSVSCGREDTPEKTATISPEFIGNWSVTKVMNSNGVFVENKDTSLYVNVSNTNISFKLPKRSGSGFGNVEKANADVVKFSDGTKVLLFNTEYPNSEKHFAVVYPDGSDDDVMVKKN